MMRTESVDMIADSLASCSLGRGDQSVTASPPSPVTPQHLAEDTDSRVQRVTVELNSETSLPYHWEQFLDLKTGEVYYINLVTAVRTTNDPRAMAATAVAYESSYFITPSDDDDDDDNDDDDEEEDYDYDDDGSSSFGDGQEDDDEDEDASISSSSTPPDASNGDSGDGKTLVAAGCKHCLMFFMVPKLIDGCPKCGGRLLHLG